MSVEELRVREGGGCGAGCGAGDEIEQRLEVAVGAEGEIGDLLAHDLGADVGAIGLQEGRSGGDKDGLRGAAGGEVEIDACGGVVEEDDVLPHLLLESLCGDGDGVGAGGKIGHGVVGAGVVDGVAKGVGVLIRCGEIRAGHGGSDGTGDGAEEGSIDGRAGEG